MKNWYTKKDWRDIGIAIGVGSLTAVVACYVLVRILGT